MTLAIIGTERKVARPSMFTTARIDPVCFVESRRLGATASTALFPQIAPPAPRAKASILSMPRALESNIVHVKAVKIDVAIVTNPTKPM